MSSDDAAPLVKKQKCEDSVRDRLQTCFYAGDVEQVLHILSHEAVTFDDTYIIDPADGKQRLLIDEAGRIGNADIALKLYELFPSPSGPYGRIITRPVYNAIKHGQNEFVDKYTRKTKHGDGEGDTNNIIEAVMLMNLEAVKILCERTKRKGCTSLGHNALVHACEMGYNEIARYLFSRGNLVEEYDYDSFEVMCNMHPFFVSIESGNHEMAEAFLTAGYVTFDPRIDMITIPISIQIPS